MATSVTFTEGIAIKSLAFKMILTGVIAALLMSAGREILYPVATVILGGLVSSTLLDCFKNSTTFESVGRRKSAQCVHEACGRDDFDDDDHGLPPAGIAEIGKAREKHASSGSVFDGGMVAAIDS